MFFPSAAAVMKLCLNFCVSCILLTLNTNQIVAFFVEGNKCLSSVAVQLWKTSFSILFNWK